MNASMPSRTEFVDRLRRNRWQIGLAAAVIAGIVFRLLWLSDIEYKSDEAWTFAHTEAFWSNHQLPWVGSASSQGLPNGGLSLWLFMAISALVPADPLSLTRGVEIVNAVGLLFLAFFVWRCVAPGEREPWAWSLALVSVNPFAVLFSRKIWEQDLLPPFTMLMLAGWWYRARNWGAALWGFIGALLGQIHLGGFFFAAAFLGVTAYYDRQTVRWRWWFLGSVIGALPLLPWLIAIITQYPPFGESSLANLNPLYFLDWIGLVSGVALNYSLGRDFGAFLGFPYISEVGQPTYLAFFVSAVIVALISAVLVRFALRLWQNPSPTLKRVFTPGSNTALALLAAFPVYGLLMILTLKQMYLHYLVIDFSLPALSLLWLDRAANRGAVTSRRLFAALVAAQAVLTVLFLSYIHVTPNIAGDYGRPYRTQDPGYSSER